MHRRTVIGSGLSILTAAALPGAGSAAVQDDAEDVDVLLSLLARVRREVGLLELMPCAAITEMARLQTGHMRDLGRTIHYGADGSDPVARARQAGYDGLILGEVVAESCEGAAETARFWLAHDETRAVLLDPAAREVGVFRLVEKTGRTWWDLAVGTPRDDGSG